MARSGSALQPFDGSATRRRSVGGATGRRSSSSSGMRLYSGSNTNNATSPSPPTSDIEPFSKKLKLIVPVIGVVALIVAVASGAIGGGGIGSIDFNALMESAVAKIASLGPYGFLYFAAIYITAEVLAVPVFPLTASSGFLFGLVPGTLTVLISATIAACISFYIGRTLLRGWAQKMTAGWPKWKAIDGAISKEGFKVILLLRLSPLLPFAVSNYLYGVTSVDFWSFAAATLLGFAPGTLGIVYAGSAGKELFAAGAQSIPWYVFLGIGASIIFAGQTIAKIASDAIKALEEEQQQQQQPSSTTPPPSLPSTPPNST